jgi:hypothetical protein
LIEKGGEQRSIKSKTAETSDKQTKRKDMTSAFPPILKIPLIFLNSSPLLCSLQIPKQAYPVLSELHAHTRTHTHITAVCFRTLHKETCISQNSERTAMTWKARRCRPILNLKRAQSRDVFTNYGTLSTAYKRLPLKITSEKKSILAYFTDSRTKMRIPGAALLQ